MCERSRDALVEVRLRGEVSLFGRVQRADGVPVARPRLHVRDETQPGRGIADQRPFWVRPSLPVLVDGWFLCRSLPAGRLTVSASESDGAWACAEFVTEPGEMLEWNPVLTRQRIEGTLRDAGGAPLAGWHVAGESAVGRVSARTDAAGVFALRDCPPVPHVVTVHAPGSWGHALVKVRDVVPGSARLHLNARAPDCVVVGRIGNAGLAADGKVKVTVWAESPEGVVGVSARSGAAFELGPLPPSPYRLTAQRQTSSGSLMVALGTHRLVSGQRLDLGEVVFPEPGSVRIVAVEADGAPATGSVALAQDGERAGTVGVVLREGTATIEVSPGSYVPLAPGCESWEHAPLEVRSGETTEVRLRRQPTWRRTFRYDLTALDTSRRCLALWRKVGVPVAQNAFDFWQHEPAEIDHWFSTGDWELELRLPDGVTHWFPFRVDAMARADPIEIRVPGR